MKKFTFFWRYLALITMLFGAVSVSQADTRELIGDVTSTSDYMSCGTVDAAFNLNVTSPDWDWVIGVKLTFPDGFTINSASLLNGEAAVITGQEIYWPVGYTNNAGEIIDDDFTVNISADETLLGDQDVAYIVSSDEYSGNDPMNLIGVAVMGENPNTTPILVITPDPLDLGMWPIGGWQEPAMLTLANVGSGVAEVTASEMDDTDNAFSLEAIILPINLTNCGDPLMVGVSLTNDATLAVGVHNATYVANWGALRNVSTVDVTVNAYTPLLGDVKENPEIWDFTPPPGGPIPSSGNSTREFGGLYKNYILPADVANNYDEVWMIDAQQDYFFSVSVTATNTNMALYAADFGGEEGPMATNALIQHATTITDFPLFEGIYYLVVGGDDDVIVGSTASMIPMGPPAQAVNVSPFDGAINITNGMDLTWTYGGIDANEYQVVLGTTYPPVDEMPWTSINPAGDSYTLAGLENNLQYFWQVNVKNGVGTTEGEIWGFTTSITPAQNVAITETELFVGDDVVLTWESPLDAPRAFLGYNVYRKDLSDVVPAYVMINTALLTELTYTDAYVALGNLDAYNMDGYKYYVSSVFTEGESLPPTLAEDANMPVATFSGEGTFNGNVADVLTPTVGIEGARLYIVGDDEYGNEMTYNVFTDVDGDYTVDVLVGASYDFTVSADGYIQETANDGVAYAATETNDFLLGEVPYPLASVTATELNDDEVHLEWTFEATTRELVDFDVYRGLWDDDFVDFTLVASTDQTQLIDFEWGLQTTGVYRWAVVANYTADQSEPTYSTPLLDKDMETVVTVNVSLNTAESPAGTMVTLTNTSEPLLDLVYETTLGDDGMIVFDPFRYGDYDVEISLDGYGEQMESVAITEATTLTYLLEEILAPVTDLYVNPNGYATWVGGTEPPPPPPVPVEFRYDDGVMFQGIGFNTGTYNSVLGVKHQPGGILEEVSWYASTSHAAIKLYVFGLDAGGLPDGTQLLYSEFVTSTALVWNTYMFPTAIDAVNGFFVAVAMDAANVGLGRDDGIGAPWEYVPGSCFYNFDYTNPAGWTSWEPGFAQNAMLRVAGVEGATRSNIAEGVIVSTNTTSASGPGLDVVEIDGPIAAGNPTWTSNRSTRAPEGFKVWLDDVYLGETTNSWYDYEAEQSLVEGEEYKAEVAAIFTTGLSDPMEYTFIYHACDYYDVHASVSADVVVGSMDVLVSWTEVTSTITGDAIVGVNVYRDGEFLAMVDAGTASYTDAQMASGDYTYCITNLYESEAQSCEVCDDVTVTPGGFVNGVVTELANGDFIEGATITIANDDASFEFTTTAAGTYAGEVVAGTYDYTVSADGYTSQILEDVVITIGVTVVNDFVLLQYPYSVGEVIAVEVSDEVVHVSWEGQGTRDIFLFEDFQSQTSGSDIDIAGWVNDATEGDRVWRGKSFSGNVYAQATSYNSDEVNETYLVLPMINLDDLNEPKMKFLSHQAFWNHDGLSVVISTDFDGTNTATATWETLNCRIAGEDDSRYEWINSGAISLSDYSGDVYLAFRYEGNGIDNVETTTYAIDDVKVYEGISGVTGYNVYRGPCGGTEDDMTFKGFTLDQQFTDNTWTSAEAGVYSWAVEVVYEFNESDFAYSNCLDKDMLTSVSVDVITNSADSPVGTEVVFTNTSEPADPPMTFETTLDDTGMYTWDDFRKGTYDISVTKLGFATQMYTDIVIWTPTTFSWILEESLIPASDLYVNPFGYATWDVGGVAPPPPPPIEILNENFDNYTAGGFVAEQSEAMGQDYWTTWTNNPGTGEDAEVSSAQSVSPSNSMLVADATDAILLLDPYTEGVFNVDFDMYIPTGKTGYYNFMLEFVFGGGSYTHGPQFYYEDGGLAHCEVAGAVVEWTYAYDTWHHASYMIDLDNDLAEFYFNGTLMATWQWSKGSFDDGNDLLQLNAMDFFAAIPATDGAFYDNFVISMEPVETAERVLEYYKVWHNELFITDTYDNNYQYGDNGEVLVPGVTYLAEVASVYSTGISEKMFYEWTYYPCDSFPGPAQFMAENITDTKDVLLTWSDNVGAPDSYSQDFEGAFPPEGWMKANPDGGSGWEAIATGTSPLPGWTGGEATACPDGGAQMAFATYTTGGVSSNDQWLISPMLESFTDFELSFYMSTPYADSYTDKVDILISTTGTEIADFDVVVEELVFMTDDGWALYTYNLTDYVESGMPIYIAFREHIEDNFFDGAAILLDNFYYGPAATRSIPEPMAAVTEGGRDENYVHVAQVDAPYQELIPSRNARLVDTFIGANIYRDDVMIAELVTDTFYVDMELAPGYYDYCIYYMYESEAYSCGDCIEDVLVPEECVVPINLTATLDENTWAIINLAWNQAQQEELRYDDGVRTAQLGFSTGTTNSVLGAVHFVDADLTELSWLLSDAADGGGPHATVTLYVMGVTEAGVPDGSNVLFTSEVSNVDGIWNTFTFNEPLMVEGGFFMGVAYNGFVGLGTDDGVGAPYEYVPGTHFYNFDLTDPTGWTSWDSGFPLNGTIRATGMVNSVLSHEVISYPENEGNGIELRRLETSIPTGTPDWTNPIANSNRSFTGYNIYRNGEVIEEDYQETTYADYQGLVGGNTYCYEVSAVYSVCGESDMSNEACAGFVGIPEFDDSDVVLYPNPATSLININSSQELTRITVINYVGQVVYQLDLEEATSVQLNSSSFENGVYVVRLDSENGVVTKRVIIAQ